MDKMRLFRRQTRIAIVLTTLLDVFMWALIAVALLTDFSLIFDNRGWLTHVEHAIIGRSIVVAGCLFPIGILCLATARTRFVATTILSAACFSSALFVYGSTVILLHAHCAKWVLEIVGLVPVLNSVIGLGVCIAIGFWRKAGELAIGAALVYVTYSLAKYGSEKAVKEVEDSESAEQSKEEQL
jgi:hypothetical protein